MKRFTYQGAVFGNVKPGTDPTFWYEIARIIDSEGKSYVIQRYAGRGDSATIGYFYAELGGFDRFDELVKITSRSYELHGKNLVGLFAKFKPGQEFTEADLRQHYADTRHGHATPLSLKSIIDMAPDSGEFTPAAPFVSTHENWGEW